MDEEFSLEELLSTNIFNWLDIDSEQDTTGDKRNEEEPDSVGVSSTVVAQVGTSGVPYVGGVEVEFGDQHRGYLTEESTMIPCESARSDSQGIIVLKVASYVINR